jgi:aminoglycoside 6'-N-acetyltransferase I
MEIVIADKTHVKAWMKMRLVLWPECLAAESEAEIEQTLSSRRSAAFIALDEARAVGFAEVSVREYVDGCTTQPVGYLEGIYIHPEYRKKGLARALVRNAESWASTRGCTEFGSDAKLDDSASIAFHNAVGFRETERQVVFLKRIEK